MTRCLLFLLMLSSPILAQNTFYAPDLRWDAGVQTHVGIVNPHLRDELTVTLTGFAVDGTVLGTRDIVLPAFARFESAANALWDGQIPAWLTLESADNVAGFVRYESTTGNDFSMVPLSTAAGDSVWVSQMIAPDQNGTTEFAVVNVSEQNGTVYSQPIDTSSAWRGNRKVRFPIEIEGMGQAWHKTTLQYLAETYHPKTFEVLSWDELYTAEDLDFVGVQHLFGSDGGLASHALPVAPRDREFFVAPLLPGLEGNSRLVLVNTYNAPMTLELTWYYEDAFGLRVEAEQAESCVELPAYGKHVINFEGMAPYKQFYNPTLLRIKSNETGLVGYQTTENGSVMAATEAVYRPGSLISLPYTPSSTSLQTTLQFTNHHDRHILVTAYGLNDAGDRIHVERNITVHPYQRLSLSSDELFGEDADQVTWTRIHVRHEAVAVSSIVSRRDGTGLAALQGVTGKTDRGVLHAADFEQFFLTDFTTQGWQEYHFFEGLGRYLNRLDPDNHHDQHNDVPPGQFFTESAYLCLDDRLFHPQGYIVDLANLALGYEPEFNRTRYLAADEDDFVALLSPWYEMPAHGRFYLSYFLRFFNPDQGTDGSRYGLIWREEGGDWQWFGITGEVLTNPNLIFFDCWQEVTYRWQDIFITPWFPFEIELPPSTYGKNIQFGLFFQHNPEDAATGRHGPTPFIDRVRISGEKLPYNFSYEAGMGKVLE